MYQNYEITELSVNSIAELSQMFFPKFSQSRVLYEFTKKMFPFWSVYNFTTFKKKIIVKIFFQIFTKSRNMRLHDKTIKKLKVYIFWLTS